MSHGAGSQGKILQELTHQQQLRPGPWLWFWSPWWKGMTILYCRTWTHKSLRHDNRSQGKPLSVSFPSFCIWLLLRPPVPSPMRAKEWGPMEEVTLAVDELECRRHFPITQCGILLYSNHYPLYFSPGLGVCDAFVQMPVSVSVYAHARGWHHVSSSITT